MPEILGSVAGGSGCGKSTLVNFLTQKYPAITSGIVFYDSDLCYTKEAYRSSLLMTKPTEIVTATSKSVLFWKDTYGANIKKLMDRCSSQGLDLVLFGLTNCGCPDFKYHMEIDASVKMWMDVDIEKSWSQYRTRADKLMVENHDFAEGIRKGTDSILSKEDYKLITACDRSYYVGEKHYVPTQPQAIVNWIDEYLQRKHSKQTPFGIGIPI